MPICILLPALRRRKAKFATPCIYARCPHQSLRLLSPTNRARCNLVKKLSARLPRCAALRGPRSKIIRKSLVLRCKQFDGVEPGSYCSGPACSPRQNEYVSVRFPSVLFRGLTFGQDTTACVPTYLVGAHKTGAAEKRQPVPKQFSGDGSAPPRFRFGFPFCSCCLFRGVCLAAAPEREARRFVVRRSPHHNA